MAYTPHPKRDPVPLAVIIVVACGGAIGLIGTTGFVVVRAILHATGIVAP